MALETNRGVGRKMEVLKRLVRGRWFVLAVGFLVLSTSGGSYSFGVYSQEMKTAMGYNQQTLDTIGFFKDLGTNVGLLAGLIFDLWSPLAVLLIGAGEVLFGYLMTWLAVSGRIPQPPLWQMCLYIAIGANSTAFLNAAVIAQCVKLFPTNRGIVIGLLKGFVGLSGAMLTQLYFAIYGPKHPSSFLLLLSWLPTGVSLASAVVLMRPLSPFVGQPDIKSFYWFLAVGVAVAAYLMGVIVAENLVTLSLVSQRAVGSVMLILLLLPLMWVVVRSELFGKASDFETLTPKTQSLLGENKAVRENPEMEIVRTSAIEPDTEACAGLQTQPDQSFAIKTGSTFLGQLEKIKQLLGNCAGCVRHGGGQQHTSTDQKKSQRGKISRPNRGEDHTLLQAYSSVDFWLLFLATTCGIGSGLTAIDNLGQIGASLGYSTIKVSTFVSLVSIWNSLGRWLAGFLSEILLQRRGTPRPTLLAATLAIMSVGHLLIACNVPGCLYVGSILIGLCFGGQTPLYTTITADIFGMRFFATLFNTIAFASPVGNYVLSVKIAGYLYDREAKKQARHVINAAPLHLGGKRLLLASPARSPASKALLCHGPTCFRLTFFLMVAVTVVGFIISVVLAVRTRQFYKDEIDGKLKQAHVKVDVPDLGEQVLQKEIITEADAAPVLKTS